MRIGIAADHGGFTMKERIADGLRAAGHEITDFGATEFNFDDDYPDFVIPLAMAVEDGKVDTGGSLSAQAEWELQSLPTRCPECEPP